MSRPIRLRGLISSRFENWLLALFLGALTLFSAVALLAVSGWFITGAAIAGFAASSAYLFDYFRPAAMIRFFAIARTAGRYAERVTSHNAALGLLKDLRCKVFAWLTKTPIAVTAVKQTNSAQQMHRLVADIDRLDHFPLQVIAPWCWASFIALSLLVFSAWIDSRLMYAMAPGILLGWLIIPLAAAFLGLKLAQRQVAAAEQRRAVFLESLNLLTPLMLWQNWQSQQQAALAADADYQQQQLQQQRLISITRLLQQFALAISAVMLLWTGLLLVEQQVISLPWMLAPLLALFGLNEALLPLAASFISLGESQAARDRLNQLRATDQNQSAATEPATANQELSSLTFSANQLSARLPAALAGPEHVSFDLSIGQALLIKGASGAGKSTLLQALVGYLPVSAGQLLVNQQAFSMAQHASLIGYLPQQLDIFDLSLAENLRIANPSTSDTELWQVLESVALADWAKQQQGLATELGEYGAKVSGGQARRIALARLLLAKRPILLLDEPLAGLDAASAQQVQASLAAYQQQAIVIVVSHQALTLPNMQTLTL